MRKLRKGAMGKGNDKKDGQERRTRPLIRRCEGAMGKGNDKKDGQERRTQQTDTPSYTKREEGKGNDKKDGQE